MSRIKYLIFLFVLSVMFISVVQAGVNTYPSHGVLSWKGYNWDVLSGAS